MTKPIKPVTTPTPINSAVEAVKDKTSSTAGRQRKARLFQLRVGILLATFAILTFLVITIPSFAIDLNISIGLQSFNNSVFSGLMTFISWVGFPPQAFIASAVIIVTLFVLGYRWESTVSLVISVIVPLLNLLIKTLVHQQFSFYYYKY